MHKMHGMDRGKSRPTKKKQQPSITSASSSPSIPAATATAATATASLSPDQRKQRQQKRTGLVINEEQQRRVAARAAKATEIQIRRRRKHWSSLVWGDRGKKAVIRRYPNGTQEILVPQTLTPDQEHYEFPPRSTLLKKLATATAERRRLQPSPNLSLPKPSSAAPSTTVALALQNNQQRQQQQQQLPAPVIQPSISPPKPDPFAIDEWFSSRKQNQKDLDVVEWIDNVEKSKHLLSPSVGRTPRTSQNSSKPFPMVQFRNEADRRLATRSSSPYVQAHQQQERQRQRQQQQQQQRQQPQHTSSSTVSLLAPPPESADKHYIPIHLLRPRDSEKSAIRAQEFWRGYRERKKPIGGMVRLVGMFHLTLEHHQRAAQERLNRLEVKLTSERRHREHYQSKHDHSQKKLDELLRNTNQQHQSDSIDHRHRRLTTLEQTVECDSIAREQLEHSVSTALQQMNLLERSIQQQAEQSRITKQDLQRQLDSVIAEIRTIRSARR